MNDNNKIKIMHICLSGPYSDKLGYQENLLSKYHVRLGYDVTLIASEWRINDSGRTELYDRNDYIDDNGVRIIRLRIKGKNDVRRKFKVYENFTETLKECNPDILFIHNVSYLDISRIAKFLKQNRQVVAYADNHADFTNSGTNILSRILLHKGIWRYEAKKIAPYIKAFYGVLPARVDFLTQIYHVPKEKCKLLVMGADDDLVKKAKENGARERVRLKYGISPQNMLIVTGGKIDQWKQQTLLLMEAVRELEILGVRLIVFGSVENDLKEQVNKLADGKTVHYAGWASVEESYDYFAAADLAVFPGRHSVYWEQATGQGLPMIVKSWEGTHHIDLGGNVEFLYEDSKEEIVQTIKEIVTDKKKYLHMKNIADTEGTKFFSYKEIAKRGIR